MSMFGKLKLLFSYNDQLEELLVKMKRDKENKERDARRHHLDLCLKHKQERNHSHFSEHNCDYCKLLKENVLLKGN